MKIRTYFVVSTVLALSLILILPVFAPRTKLTGNCPKIVQLSWPDDWGDRVIYCTFNKRGWQEWRDNDGDGTLDLYVKFLYPQLLPEEAVAEMIGEDWEYYQLKSGDPRVPYVEYTLVIYVVLDGE